MELRQVDHAPFKTGDDNGWADKAISSAFFYWRKNVHEWGKWMGTEVFYKFSHISNPLLINITTQGYDIFLLLLCQVEVLYLFYDFAKQPA